jgi:hypothetical protein
MSGTNRNSSAFQKEPINDATLFPFFHLQVKGVEMKRDGIRLIILVILIIAGCSPASPAMQESALTVAPPTPSEGYHPLGTRTGIEVIDRVLGAVAGGDRQELFSVVEFTDAVCTKLEGMGGPPKCREAEAEGAPVEVLPFLSSEGSFLRDEEIEQWTGVDPVGVYAIYEVNAAVLTSEQYYPVGEYVILYVREKNQPAIALRISESGIVRVDEIFDASEASLNGMIERESSTVILAPVSQ